MNQMRLLLIGVLALATVLIGVGLSYPGVVERAIAGGQSSDSDGDGLPDPADPLNPQPGEDFCPALAEDPDGVDQQDGCPDTDVSVAVQKQESYTVTVGAPVIQTVDIWVQNGNYPANVMVHALAVSTIGACEVSFQAEAGDVEMPLVADEDGDTVAETLQYLLEWQVSLSAGELYHTTRDYQVVCFLAGADSFEIQVDAVPMLPVEEEDVMNLANVHKNFPVVTVVDPASPDADGDGYTNAGESFMGTDYLVSCNDGAGLPDWPPDFNDDRRAALADVLSFIPGFNTADPDPLYSRRFDLNTDDRISLADALEFIPIFNTTCAP